MHISLNKKYTEYRLCWPFKNRHVIGQPLCCQKRLAYWSFVHNVCQTRKLLILRFVMMSCLAQASAMHNPIIYALSHPRFREVLNTRFPWLLCCCQYSAKEAEAAAESKATKAEGASEVDRSGTALWSYYCALVFMNSCTFLMTPSI